MRAWTLMLACVLPLVLAHGTEDDPTNTPERDCCAALLVEGEEGSLDAAGKYRLPAICRGVPSPVTCPQLGFITDGNIIQEPAWLLAYEGQAEIRHHPSCSPVEWEQRCPPGATMLLSKKRGGCRAAGCVAAAVEGELTAQQSINVGQDVADDTAILRAVTGQVTARLQAEKPDRPMSFYWHVRGLRRSFDKAQKRWSREVAQAMKAEEMDMELLRSLTDGAMMKGFRGGKLEEAVAVVAQYDRQQAGVAMMRSLPERLMSKAARVARDVRRRSDAQLGRIAGLEQDVLLLSSTIKRLQHSAAIDAARLASERTAAKAASDDAAALARALRDEVEGLQGTVANLQTAAAADAARLEFERTAATTASNDAAVLSRALRADVEGLQVTVANLETAAAADAAKFLTMEADLRAELVAADGTIDSLKSAVQHQRQDLASCLQDTAEVDEASFALSLLAATSTHLLGGGLQPATPRPAEATTWAAAGLSAAHEARQRTCARLEGVATTIYSFSAKKEEEERKRQDLQEKVVDLQNEVEEAETAADSCAASLENVDKQTVAVLTAVEKAVGAQRWSGEGRVSSAATYEKIRTRLGEIRDVALAFTRQLLDDLSGCQVQLEEVEERAMDRLEETMACDEEARETQAAFSTCAAGLQRLDSQSLDLARFLADKAMQAGAPVSIADAVEAPKPPVYGLLDFLFRPRGVSDDATVTTVPSRVGARLNAVRDMTAATMSKFDADMAACRDRIADGCNGTGPAKKGSSSDSSSDSSSGDSSDRSADSDTGSDGAITDMDAAEDDKPICGDTVAEEVESMQPIDDGNDPPKLGEP